MKLTVYEVMHIDSICITFWCIHIVSKQALSACYTQVICPFSTLLTTDKHNMFIIYLFIILFIIMQRKCYMYYVVPSWFLTTCRSVLWNYMWIMYFLLKIILSIFVTFRIGELRSTIFTWGKFCIFRDGLRSPFSMFHIPIINWIKFSRFSWVVFFFFFNGV